MSGLPVFVIRPEPGNAATVAAARAQGLDARGFPLFTIAAQPWSLPDGPFDAILAGSANIFRHGGPLLDALKAVPVIAVGETTADTARAHGFAVESVGEGGLQPVVETLTPGRYLRLAGEDRVTLTPHSGVRIETSVVYAAQPHPLPPEMAQALAHGGVVLLHSGAAARHLSQYCEMAEIPRKQLRLACLAPRIASMAGEGWGQIGVASARTDMDLLELAKRMCQ
ncbi:uroporphyrinogen-III synthase [Novosphingobium sp. SL115]|uniref:uroporphyrinogen-III synthase n=1 Tax=Novosphingobium sp. SL115 TaxID=2995150 RepID=UPI002274A938|nr:uroporphyrinogen-III synthase [Novosphingobium sp. SL115]MCY1669766.1 uroporphyrinogen-III synthase [Novosphingobium sp. SL115]